MEAEGLSQADIADAAKVSQSTVSRALRGAPARKTKPYRRLCNYIHEQTLADAGGPKEAVEALRRVWDGTGDHAAALANLIEVSGRLWPELAKRTDDQNR